VNIEEEKDKSGDVLVYLGGFLVGFWLFWWFFMIFDDVDDF